MVKNATSESLEAIPRPMVALGNDYPANYEIAPHRHGRAQLLYSGTGTMTVRTEHGAWVVPPEEGVWIPAGIQHSVGMIGQLTTSSIYIDMAAVPDMPTTCQVLSISPLMRSLLQAAVNTSPEYEPQSRDGLIMALMLAELRLLPVLPLSLPFPRHHKLARRCRSFLEKPHLHQSIDDWADAMAMSRRTFTRLFKRETGMSFAVWIRQACLFSALRRLAQGDSVTTIALDLGYDSPSAFTTMFKRVLGVPPSRYLAQPAPKP